MILADENIFKGLIQTLRDNNFAVCSVFEDYRGFSDEEIAKLSLHSPRIILTEDKDFGNLIFERNIEVTGVIFLRFLNTEKETIITEVLNFLVNQSIETMTGHYFTIPPKKLG